MSRKAADVIAMERMRLPFFMIPSFFMPSPFLFFLIVRMLLGFYLLITHIGFTILPYCVHSLTMNSAEYDFM